MSTEAPGPERPPEDERSPGQPGDGLQSPAEPAVERRCWRPDAAAEQSCGVRSAGPQRKESQEWTPLALQQES